MHSKVGERMPSLVLIILKGTEGTATLGGVWEKSCGEGKWAVGRLDRLLDPFSKPPPWPQFS